MGAGRNNGARMCVPLHPHTNQPRPGHANFALEYSYTTSSSSPTKIIPSLSPLRRPGPDPHPPLTSIGHIEPLCLERWSQFLKPNKHISLHTHYSVSPFHPHPISASLPQGNKGAKRDDSRRQQHLTPATREERHRDLLLPV